MTTRFEFTPDIEVILDKLALIHGESKTEVIEILIGQEATRIGLDYNASSIKILQPEEASERFEWLKIQDLANHYHCTIEWIERGFEACWMAGVDKQYFISRYLEKDATVQINARVNDAYRDLLHEKAGETT